MSYSSIFQSSSSSVSGDNALYISSLYFHKIIMSEYIEINQTNYNIWLEENENGCLCTRKLQSRKLFLN